jgi:hypothetical protein
MNNSTLEKNVPAKKPGRTASEALADRERAAQLGVPEFLVRMVDWKRLKALPATLPARLHCD